MSHRRRSEITDALLAAGVGVVLSTAASAAAYLGLREVLETHWRLIALALAVSFGVAGGLTWRRLPRLPGCLALTGQGTILVLVVLSGWAWEILDPGGGGRTSVFLRGSSGVPLHLDLPLALAAGLGPIQVLGAFRLHAVRLRAPDPACWRGPAGGVLLVGGGPLLVAAFLELLSWTDASAGLLAWMLLAGGGALVRFVAAPAGIGLVLLLVRREGGAGVPARALVVPQGLLAVSLVLQVLLYPPTPDYLVLGAGVLALGALWGASLVGLLVVLLLDLLPATGKRG